MIPSLERPCIVEINCSFQHLQCNRYLLLVEKCAKHLENTKKAAERGADPGLDSTKRKVAPLLE